MRDDPLFTVMLSVVFTLIVVLVMMAIVSSASSQSVKEANQRACRWYASQNHEKEFAPERYAKLKDMIDNFDWYTACMNNLENPVAK